jgi:hypothetical protein
MRYAALAILFFPVNAFAFVGYSFSGSDFFGSLEMDEQATQYEQPNGDPNYAHYKANGNFFVDFGDRRLVKSGILDITVYQNDGGDGIQVKMENGQWTDTGEAGFGWWCWAYSPGTFNGTSYSNIDQRGPIQGGLGLTAKYVGGEVFDQWETKSEFSAMNRTDAASLSAPTANGEAPVPEPGTIALFGMGLAGLGLLRPKSRP